MRRQNTINGTANVPPTLSVVIEWENAGRIGCDRAGRMLAQLHRQLAELPTGMIGETEILFIHDAAQVDDGWLKAEVETLGLWSARLRFLRSQVAGYYEQKNEGAALAKGDIILFVDSDVVPETGWLEALLRPVAVGNAKIVAGSTSVERTGLYSKAMALGWIFPLPPDEKGLRGSSLFYANNVAFRREMIAKMRFPETAQYRVQIGTVHRRLAEEGVPIVMSGAASVLHPPPLGWSGFITRALWCGYDASTVLRRPRPGRIWKAPLALAREALGAMRRVARDRRRTELGVLETASALGVILAFHAIRSLGFAAGLAAPRATWRQLKRIAP